MASFKLPELIPESTRDIMRDFTPSVGHAPLLHSIQSTLSPRATRKYHQVHPEGKDEEKLSVPRVALLGGGPSSIIPLMYCREVLENVAHVEYFGDPWDSLILKGRDPQKTLISLLNVATKYETYSNLASRTMLYYRYLYASSKTFNISLEESISRAYNRPSIGEEILLWCRSIGKFVVGVSRSEKVFISVWENVGSDKATAIAVDSTWTVNLSSFNNDVYVKSEHGELVPVSQHEAIVLEDLSECHADFHYAASLFPGWREVEEFQKQGSSLDVIIDRSGFAYPCTALSDTNKLLATMNLEYNVFVRDLMANYAKEKMLNPLQKTLLNVVEKYISSTEQNNEDTGNLIQSNSSFIVLGAGRAAGEFSRRLANDKIHSGSTNQLCVELNLSNDSAYCNSAIKKLQAQLESRRKRVLTIDHRRLDLISTPAIHDLLQNVAYKDYLREIINFEVIPRISATDKQYYDNLKTAIDNLLKNSVEDLSFVGVAKSVSKSLGTLLEKQGISDSGYYLILTNSRHSHDWDDHTRNTVKAFAAVDTTLMVNVGGAHHEFARQETSAGQQSKNLEYALGRIQDSHYRPENVPLISLLAEEDQLLEEGYNLERLGIYIQDKPRTTKL